MWSRPSEYFPKYTIWCHYVFGICTSNVIFWFWMFLKMYQVIIIWLFSIFALNRSLFSLWLCLHGFFVYIYPTFENHMIIKITFFCTAFEGWSTFLKTNVSSLTVHRSPQSCDFVTNHCFKSFSKCLQHKYCLK